MIWISCCTVLCCEWWFGGNNEKSILGNRSPVASELKTIYACECNFRFWFRIYPSTHFRALETQLTVYLRVYYYYTCNSRWADRALTSSNFILVFRFIRIFTLTHDKNRSHEKNYSFFVERIVVARTITDVFEVNRIKKKERKHTSGTS